MSVPSEVHAAMEEVIAARAHRFTVGALLDALHSIGYEDEQIEFRSHATTTHQSAVVSAVTFAAPPQRRVVVELNLGLLAPQSLLPSYFHRVLDRQAEGALSGFLNFLSHRLLGSLVEGQFPERDPSLFPVWPDTLEDLRSLLGTRTLSTMHWLCEQIFPELGVSVSRSVLSRTIRSRGIQVGQWGFGDGAVLGSIAKIPVSGITVKLFADEAMTGCGEPWSKEANQRLFQRLFPLLARQGIHLEVALILRDQQTFMILEPNQFLGYMPLYGGAGAAPHIRSARTIILWSGEVPSS